MENDLTFFAEENNNMKKLFFFFFNPLSFSATPSLSPSLFLSLSPPTPHCPLLSLSFFRPKKEKRRQTPGGSCRSLPRKGRPRSSTTPPTARRPSSSPPPRFRRQRPRPLAGGTEAPTPARSRARRPLRGLRRRGGSPTGRRRASRHLRCCRPLPRLRRARAQMRGSSACAGPRP